MQSFPNTPVPFKRMLEGKSGVEMAWTKTVLEPFHVKQYLSDVSCCFFYYDLPNVVDRQTCIINPQTEYILSFSCAGHPKCVTSEPV